MAKKEKKGETSVVSARVRVFIKTKLAEEASLRSVTEGKLIAPNTIIEEMLEERYKEKKSILDMLD